MGAPSICCRKSTEKDIKEWYSQIRGYAVMIVMLQSTTLLNDFEFSNRRSPSITVENAKIVIYYTSFIRHHFVARVYKQTRVTKWFIKRV
jgi:hypothetical protein